MNREWTIRPVRFPFIFYGKKLFAVDAPMAVLSQHFTRLGEDFDPVELPFSQFPSAVGAYIQSQPIRGELPRLATSGSLLRFVPQQYNRFVIDVQGTFEQYLEKFSAKTRYNLKRQVKKWGEAAGGGAFFRVFSTPDELVDWHRQALTVAAHTYQTRLLEHGLPDDDAFREELRQRGARGEAWGALLYHQGQPVAFWYFTVQGDICVSEHTGYLPEHRKLSPGTVLLFLALERVFGRGGIRLFDFGEGDADYKELFATRSQRCGEVYYLKLQPRNLSIVSLDLALWGTRRLLKPVEDELARRGIKSRLKRLLRS
jgi:hypothetical protein